MAAPGILALILEVEIAGTAERLHAVGVDETDIANAMLDRSTQILLRLYGPEHCAALFRAAMRVHQNAVAARERRRFIAYAIEAHGEGRIPPQGEA